MEGVTASPLSWPTGQPRTTNREYARFDRNCTVHKAVQRIYLELDRLGVPDYEVIISTNLELRLDGIPKSNQRAQGDPGAAVYFRMPEDSGDDHHVLACDRWDRVEHNLWAIALHIDALRAIERWGVGSREQLFQGFQGIPASTGGTPWWKVLGYDDPDLTKEEVDRAFRERAKDVHPDRPGGSHDAMAALSDARRQAYDALAVGSR